MIKTTLIEEAEVIKNTEVKGGMVFKCPILGDEGDYDTIFDCILVRLSYNEVRLIHISSMNRFNNTNYEGSTISDMEARGFSLVKKGKLIYEFEEEFELN